MLMFIYYWMGIFYIMFRLLELFKAMHAKYYFAYITYIYQHFLCFHEFKIIIS